MKSGLIVVLLSASALAQNQESPLKFEFSDVHASAPVANPTMRGGGTRGGRFEVRQATVVDLIGFAYRMDSDKIVGGPRWLDWDRFDVSAKVPAAAKREDLSPMLQSLLAERFQLAAHKDTKALPAVLLTAGKDKPKMKQSSDSEEGGCKGVPQTVAPGAIPYIAISCHNVTMPVFSMVLQNYGGGNYLADPVIDKTGLSGSWDFDLKWTPRNRLALAGADGISMFDAVEKQLGLKLEAGKAPQPVLIVDNVNETPTPNEAGVAAKIPPPPPTEFEVASIKPSSPDARGQNGRIQGGRVDLQNYTLKQMIQMAWELRNDNDEMLVGLPSSAETARYDLQAKVATSGPAKEDDIDFDALRVMLQALLTERFGLKVHTEQRPLNAFVMTATKQVKLEKADPQNRTNCKTASGTSAMLNRKITCTNMNMEQFAAVLQDLAGGYVKAPIRDATGIEGYWDLSISFSGINLLPGAKFDPNAGSQTQTTDPNGSLSLPEALQKQLGLKLEMGKRPLPVLVVDHVLDKPTEN